MFELKVIPGRYPTTIMSQLVEQTLKFVNPEEDWSAHVNQIDDQTLQVDLMKVD